MNPLRQLYLNLYLLVYALYAFFNKGIAYGYFSEILLLVGLVWVVKDIRHLELPWTPLFKTLVALVLVVCLQMLRSAGGYPLVEVVRDSFVLNYAFFVIIVVYFKDQADYLWQGFYKIYAWLPLVALVSFLLISFVPFFETFVVFGNVPLLLYKYNDLGLHLLMASLLMLMGKIKIKKKYLVANAIIIVYLLLVAAAYNRSGLLAYAMGLGLFFWFSQNESLKAMVQQNLKFLPILVLVALTFYGLTQVKENFQGRKVGLGQLRENVVSIVSTNTDGTLNDNKIWRLTWWAKIVSDAFSSPQFFLVGRGLGMSLAEANEIPGDDDSLRSPHSIHLNYLARFGVPFFLVWMAWAIGLIKQVQAYRHNAQMVFTLSVLLASLVNASFDVYFEGPMGAFPFWTFLGLYFVQQMKEPA
jgi:hypothetical protein